MSNANKPADGAAEIARLRAELEAAAKAMADAEAERERDARALRAERDAARKAEVAAKADAEAARSEKRAAEEMLDEMHEQIRVRPLAPGARVGAPLYFAKCEISNSGSPIKPGELLSFDPTDPPPGFDGFVEGVHYTKG